VLIVGLAAIVIGERVRRGFVVWSALAVAGMLLVVYQPGTAGSLAGIALTLAGVVCCAVYSVLTRRLLGPLTETAPVVLVQQLYALGAVLVLLAGATVLGVQVVPEDVSSGGWLSAIGSGVLYYAAAYAAYLAALRRVPASRAAASFYLIPVFGIGGGILLLGETLAPVQLLGAAAVVVGVAGALVSEPSTTPHPLPT
jgi:drug/metabolite transporter (DMT)-like permease